MSHLQSKNSRKMLVGEEALLLELGQKRTKLAVGERNFWASCRSVSLNSVTERRRILDIQDAIDLKC